ncbi:MAG: protein translocase subunit SecD [Rhodospirillales bacterium]|nr:protein translocase subunit SecD [Rhodospirillales bacterium]
MLTISRSKLALVIAICLLGIVFAVPNLMSAKRVDALPSWLHLNHLSLGLDLQGGSHLLLRVSVEEIANERVEGVVDAVRTQLRNARIRYTGLGADRGVVNLVIPDADRIEESARILRQIDPGTTVTVGEGGRITIVYTEKSIRDRRLAAIDQSIEIVRRRIDETGVREPTIQRQGDDRILVQLPGIDDPERIKGLLGKTAKMTFHLLDQQSALAEAQAGRVPPGSLYLPSDEVGPDGKPRNFYVVQRRVMVDGGNLVDSRQSFDQRSNEPIVSFRFDTVGARRFRDVTRDNVGKPFAIVLDGKVISAPIIREAILGGSGQISGNFTVASANDLSLLLRAGALPAPLEIIEERTVGPGLGADSITAGALATIAGLVMTVGFMILFYGFFGVIANVALFFNFVLLIAVLTILQATLTLPGIAGILLTLAMAVDANVLIYERFREETQAGRGPVSALDAGFSGAFTAIIDSNMTTLIAGLMLFQFGSGPVRGFAVTLSVGILTTMFTAIMVTRYLIVGWLRWARPQTLPV